MKLKKYKTQNITTLIIIALPIMICLFLAFVFLFLATPNFNKKYISTNIPIESENNDTSNTTYNYYLDISPSMIGFMKAGNNLNMIADTFSSINNQSISSKNYYFCNDSITDQDENTFYGSMKSDSILTEIYERIVNNGTIENTLSNMELSKIYTGLYANGKSFPNTKNDLNIIITDMNFMPTNKDIKTHNERLNQFTDAFVKNISDKNLCIYNIYDNFDGILSDELPEYGINNESGNNYSYFIIIFGANDREYNSYLESLESELIKNNIDYVNKFEICNDMKTKILDFSVDSNILYDNDKTVLENFNYDMKSFDFTNSDSIGLRTIRKGNISTIVLPIMPIDLPGYYNIDEYTSNSNDINVITKVAYQKGNIIIRDYVEYTNEDIVRSAEGYISNMDGKLYLYCKLGVTSDIKINDALYDYIVVDIRFEMKKPNYTLPKWVKEISADTIEDRTKKINIEDFFFAVISTKSAIYDNLANDYQRYMGNIFVYINY